MSSSSVALIKNLFNKTAYDRFNSLVRFDFFPQEVQVILESLEDYLKVYDKNDVDIDEFKDWFLIIKHPNLIEAKRELYQVLFRQIKDCDPLPSQEYLKKLKTVELSKELYSMLDKDAFDLEKTEELIRDYKAFITANNTEKPWVENSIETIANNCNRSNGLFWRLSDLNKAIGPLMPGDFTIVAAPVDCGKTAFAISEAVYMARQIKDDGCVLWLNNEEFNHRVLKKIWKCALKKPWDYIEDKQDKAQEAYSKTMNGDKDRIKLVDIRDYDIGKIRALFEELNPKLVVVDQIDKISNVTKKHWKEHDRLKVLYGIFRQLANEYCPVIAISQVDASTSWMRDGEIEYQRYIDMKQLDGSKVGKQGEADFIITIGRDLSLPKVRYINLPKNKSDLCPELQNYRAEVKFDGDLCIYENV